MGFFKRLAFYAGLAAGVAFIAAAGTSALTYLFTGKFSAFEFGREGARLKLMTVDEIVDLVRERMAKARAKSEETASRKIPAESGWPKDASTPTSEQGGEYHA